MFIKIYLIVTIVTKSEVPFPLKNRSDVIGLPVEDDLVEWDKNNMSSNDINQSRKIFR